MEGAESLLETIFDDDGVEDAQDVEMLDVEEGELIEPMSKTGEGVSCDGGQINQESNTRNSRRKKKKKKRNKGNTAAPNVNNINRFVLDTCKRLREKKSYLMWNAVGCLGVSALADLIKEVDAIQACGGQKTADGSRFRNGGGILWNIIKTRDPNAYKEIMRKGREFEKQFNQQLNEKKEPKHQTEACSQSTSPNNHTKSGQVGGPELISDNLNQLELSTSGQKRGPVHDRIRLQVTYDDLVGGEDPKDEPVSK